jgi:transcriptional regulator with XRE-family HTH domain
MSSQVPNYLRAHRKRLGLSQDDVAFLLGVVSGTKVCRYERFLRGPTLLTVLALAIIFQKPVNELFAGLSKKVEKQIEARAKVLAHRISRSKQTTQNRKRTESLLKIAQRLDSKNTKSA